MNSEVKKQPFVLKNRKVNSKSLKATEASTKATELRKGGNRADSVLRRFD